MASSTIRMTIAVREKCWRMTSLRKGPYVPPDKKRQPGWFRSGFGSRILAMLASAPVGDGAAVMSATHTAVILRSRALARRLERWPPAQRSQMSPVADPSRLAAAPRAPQDDGAVVL